MTPAAYLRSLSGLRLAQHTIRAAKAGRTPLEHAAEVLRQQEQQDAISAALRDHNHCMRVLARHAANHGRSLL